MSILRTRQVVTIVAPMVALALALPMIQGCSRPDDDYRNAASSPTQQAKAVQSSIASAQSTHEQEPPATAQPMGAAAPMAPATGSVDSPPANMAAGAPTGMDRMLGHPPTVAGPGGAGGLPPAMGAPHLYHLGADTFFLDQTSIGLGSEQQKRLAAIKDGSSAAYATTQRKIDQGEQDLWVLTSSEAPDVAKIEAKVGEIARLSGQQRVDFIRSVGDAVGVLSDAQRKAVASQGMAMPPGAAPPAPIASGMGAASGAPSGGMGMGMGMGSGAPPAMPPSAGSGGAMPPPAMGMGGMPPAGSPTGTGHM